jgi:hypothetical protein
LPPTGRFSASASMRAAAMRCRQKGALLHHATGTHSHVRIAGDGPTAFRLSEGVEVETAGFVGTVVGTEPRADAAVIDHDIQSLFVVHGGADRADDLARSLFAMLAHDRLEQHVWGVRVVLVVAIDTQPVISRSRMTCALPTVGMLFSAMPCRRRCRHCSRCRNSGRCSCPRRAVRPACGSKGSADRFAARESAGQP